MDDNDLILLDVGSTMIKGVRYGPGIKVESYFRTRGKGGIVKEVSVLLDEMNGDTPASSTRICSSANGGLSIGLICLSTRISGNVAMRVLESTGANIRFMVTWTESIGLEKQVPVDVLIIVGGIDAFPSREAVRQFENISLAAFTYDRLIYAGHRDMSNVAQKKWPDIVIVQNMMVMSLRQEDDTLPIKVRDQYLEDIQCKREILPLQDKSAMAILPTPAVVSQAFAHLQKRLLTPAILFDIGGATTDLHFARELLDDRAIDTASLSYPETARHVYTAFGVAASRTSTLCAFFDDHHCVDLLYELYGDSHRKIYADLLEGKAVDGLLFVICIFLVLRDVVEGRNGSPSLNFSQIMTIALTGGASHVIGKVEIQAAFRAVFGRETHAEIIIDREYRWWTLGLLNQEEIYPTVWNACHV